MDFKFCTTIIFALSFFLAGCGATDYEFTDRNATGAVIGAGVGAGGAALLHGSESIIALSGLGGAIVGYYVTTLRFQSEGVIRSGGQVFTQGDFVMIDIPSDVLFDVNTSDFLDNAAPILNSAASVLMRYPNDNILISGNTSGFASSKYEQKLSEERARKVAQYLWDHGINDYRNYNTKDGLNDYMNPKKMRNLTYTGFGSAFPIANHVYNDSIRQNSRIQITAYPRPLEMKQSMLYKSFYNIGKYKQ